MNIVVVLVVKLTLWLGCAASLMVLFLMVKTGIVLGLIKPHDISVFGDILYFDIFFGQVSFPRVVVDEMEWGLICLMAAMAFWSFQKVECLVLSLYMDEGECILCEEEPCLLTDQCFINHCLASHIGMFTSMLQSEHLLFGVIIICNIVMEYE